MAKGTMANYTGKILWRSPDNQAGLISKRTNGTSVFPGAVVTSTGETDPDVALPDGDDDVSEGIALDRADMDIDSTFADDTTITVAQTRSGAGVWGFVDDDEGAIEPWTALYSTGADDDGYLEVLDTTSVPSTYDDSTIQTIVDELGSAEHRYVGRAATHQGDQGSTDVPIKVLMI